MVDVSAQSSCTVTPLNPTTLTATGGVLPIGAMNVMIQCNCTDDDGTVVNHVRWYDPDGNRIFGDRNDQFDNSTPYFTKASGDTHVILVIPTFIGSYDGTYKCGNRNGENDDGPGSPNVDVTLTIEGEVMIITVSILCTELGVINVLCNISNFHSNEVMYSIAQNVGSRKHW